MYLHKSECARILLLQGPGEGSHYFTATAIGEAMVKRGHKVTILISDLYAYRAESPKDAKLYTFEIYNSSMTAETRDEWYTAMNKAVFKGQFLQFAIANMSKYSEIAIDECSNILKDDSLLGRLKAANFDLILVDMIFNCPLVIAQYLNRPFIYFVASSVIPNGASFRIRLPVNPAYIPDMMSGIGDRMNFITRLKNTIGSGLGMLMHNAIVSPYEMLKVKYNIKPDISIYDAPAEAELWFVHLDFALDFPRPMMPNVIPIGGLTTKPATALPDVSMKTTQIRTQSIKGKHKNINVLFFLV